MLSSMEAQRLLAIKVAESLLWTPYRWGGDDPMMGVDCSGFWMEILWTLGIARVKDDYSASSLFNLMVPTNSPEVGDAIFWANDEDKIVHVEMIYSVVLNLSIGASGGGPSTIDGEAAAQQNAYVKIRPYLTRGRKIAGFRNPYLKRLGV